MKRATFKVQSGKSGWIETTIAPIHDKQAVPFTKSDLALLMGLVVMGLLALITIALPLTAAGDPKEPAPPKSIM